jgi:branched-chain amino acid transport system substrate-binding protein
VLSEERDDAVANNSTEIQRLVTQGDSFAILPVASLLFTGAETAVRQDVPTFGWTINPEWQGTRDDPRANMFGQAGSFLCFDCARPELAWVAQHLDAHRVGVLAYAVPQSAECARGVQASFDRYGPDVDARLVYSDESLSFGVGDLSVQVSRMKDEGVDMIATCMDSNGVVTLAREAKRQDLDAAQYLVNAYDQGFLDEYGDLFEGSLVRTDFVQWDVEDEPPGLENFLEWMDRNDSEPTENAMVGWLNADLFVTGLREAGAHFTRQKLIDAINRMTDYTADGLLPGIDWTTAHEQPQRCVFFSEIHDGEFVPVSDDPDDPFVCAAEQDGEIVDLSPGEARAEGTAEGASAQ